MVLIVNEISDTMAQLTISIHGLKVVHFNYVDGTFYRAKITPHKRWDEYNDAKKVPPDAEINC